MDYTCRTHPEVLQSSPGSCPLCGIALEKEQPFPIKYVAIFSLLLLLVSTYLFYDNWKASLPQSIESSIQSMLPKKESLVYFEQMKGGFANDIWHVYTDEGHYILREKVKKVSGSAFIKDVEMARKASEYGIGPELMGFNVRGQQLLLRYVEHSPWPKYLKNDEPYKKTMLALRTFHEKMPRNNRIDQQSTYAPFGYILLTGKKLVQRGAVPSHFSIALAKAEEIFNSLKPWLKEHAVLCHGDFCKQNVLLSPTLTPLLIDFDSASIGDPFFDIAKFTLLLSKDQRLELFKTYLHSPSLSLEELKHFEAMDLALLMLITTIRFNAAFLSPAPEKLSQEEMESILNSGKPLPSFLSVPFEDITPKSRQLGALYALSEFLHRSAIY